jgi:hypothetical protein
LPNYPRSCGVASTRPSLDSQGDTITKYQFWDSTSDANSGHFVVNGNAQGVNQAIDVTAAQLAQTTFQTGSGADQL